MMISLLEGNWFLEELSDSGSKRVGCVKVISLAMQKHLTFSTLNWIWEAFNVLGENSETWEDTKD